MKNSPFSFKGGCYASHYNSIFSRQSTDLVSFKKNLNAQVNAGPVDILGGTLGEASTQPPMKKHPSCNHLKGGWSRLP